MTHSCISHTLITLAHSYLKAVHAHVYVYSVFTNYYFHDITVSNIIAASNLLFLFGNSTMLYNATSHTVMKCPNIQPDSAFARFRKGYLLLSVTNHTNISIMEVRTLPTDSGQSGNFRLPVVIIALAVVILYKYLSTRKKQPIDTKKILEGETSKQLKKLMEMQMKPKRKSQMRTVEEEKEEDEADIPDRLKLD